MQHSINISTMFLQGLLFIFIYFIIVFILFILLLFRSAIFRNVLAVIVNVATILIRNS